MASIESWLEGPRWNDLSSWLMKTAISLKLKCITDVRKGIFRQTVFYKIDGENENLLLFKKEIEKLVCR